MSEPERLLATAISSGWRPPRPRRVADLRDAVIQHAASPVSLQSFEAGTFPWHQTRSAPESGTAAAATVRGRQQELAGATLFFVDGVTSMLSADYGKGPEWLSLPQDLPPAAYGFMVCATPLISDERGDPPRLDVVAVSWRPSQDESLPDGGVDVTFWAAPTHHVVSHVISLAEMPNTPRNRVIVHSGLGPLFPVKQMSWGYGHTDEEIDPNSDEAWLIAVKGVWIAIAEVPHVTVTRVRPSWPRRRRRGDVDVVHHVRWHGKPQPEQKRQPPPDQPMLFGDTVTGQVEDIELSGNLRLVASDALPANCDRRALRKLGIKVGKPVAGDPLFRHATLPPGWKKVSAGGLWSHIVDEHGRRRVEVFYKAAPYDRRAFARVLGSEDED